MLALAGGLQGLCPNRVKLSRKSLAERARDQFLRKALPSFVAYQRWFAAKGDVIEQIEFVDQAIWSECNCLLALFKVMTARGEAHLYFIPLSLIWEQDDRRVNALLPYTVTRVRQQARTGIIIDAFADENFCREWIEAIGTEREIRMEKGRIRCSRTSVYAETAGESTAKDVVSTPGAEGSNTTVVIGNKMFLKGYRRLQEGLNPELEIGRFLTEHSHFANGVPVAGGAEYQSDDGHIMTLAILQRHVANQGSGWSFTLDYLRRFFQDVTTGAVETPRAAHDTYLDLTRTVGQRTGELHTALAAKTGDPNFDPEPLTSADIKSWVAKVLDEARQTLGRLANSENRDEPDVGSLLAAREALMKRIRACEVTKVKAAKTRYHGDYHLGQILLAHNDVVIIDFEGEPARTLDERRKKHSALKDVAGMLRSFNYAAYGALLDATEGQLPDFAQLEPHAREWEQLVAEAFLAGYDEAAQECPAYPADPDDARRLIELFTLEKALYEVRYELANRPKWVAIPIKGLLTILASQ